MLRLWIGPLVLETVRMHQGSETTAAAALGRLRAEDERAAVDAEAALGSLTWDQGLQAITQHGLQTFLWYELPRKWLTDLEGKLHIAAALGRLLELVGLPRYAAICRGLQTTAVLQAYERGDREGIRAFRRAQERSGVEPPDLPGSPLWFGWGPVMGEREAGAFFSMAAALELAVAGGELRPGARGWRTAQQAVARRHLAAPRPELDGQSWLEVVVAERLGEWARSRSEARRTLVEPVLGRLATGPLRPVPVPPGAEEALAPLRWLLASASEGRGIALTQVGNLNRPTVIEAVRRFDWHPLPDPPRGEDDVFELWVLRDLVRDLGAVRRSGRWLVTTRVGRTLAGDPEMLWYAVAHRLGGGHDFAATVTELALLLLVEAGEVAEATLAERVNAAVVGEGWHERASGRPPDPPTVRGQLVEPLRLLEVLGLRHAGGDWRSRWVALTEQGRALALEALRARATGPRPDPRDR
jgi:hypothetical protein